MEGLLHRDETRWYTLVAITKAGVTLDVHGLRLLSEQLDAAQCVP